MVLGQNNEHSLSSVGFVPTLLSNLLPVAGILWFDWQVSDLFTVYWVEIWVLLVVYCGAALFAQQPLVSKGRTLTLPGVHRQQTRNESRWGGEPQTVTLLESIPPVYPRNFRLVRMTFLWGAGFLLLPLLEFGGAMASSFSLSLFGTAAAMMVSHALDLRREFFARRQYEELSAHMVLEIPGRLVMFWTIYLAVLVFVGGIILVTVGALSQQGGLTLPEGVSVLIFQSMVVVGKLGIEWSKYRAEHDPEPSGFATWFLPEDPRTERA